VRRLYDVANVLASLGVVEKIHVQTSRKPGFRLLRAPASAGMRAELAEVAASVASAVTAAVAAAPASGGRRRVVRSLVDLSDGPARSVVASVAAGASAAAMADAAGERADGKAGDAAAGACTVTLRGRGLHFTFQPQGMTLAPAAGCGNATAALKPKALATSPSLPLRPVNL
jgi:hypothetical protein